MKELVKKLFVGVSVLLCVSDVCIADTWSITELQYQYGELDIPLFAGGGTESVSTYTLKNASGWSWGDSFIFIDHTVGSDQGSGFYGEFYPNMSLSKVTNRTLSYGVVKDLGVFLGVNAGRKAKFRKYLPGFRIAFDLPGFVFLNLDSSAYIDGNKGIDKHGAPKEDDSFMVDLNGSYHGSWGSIHYEIEGHIEYIGSRMNELGQKVSHHILAQPQFRIDVGRLWFEEKQKLYLGMEYQYWRNKLGDSTTDEYAPQFLFVWRI